jgi:hypothetical protein
MDTALFLTIIIFLLSLILIAVAIYLILLLNEARESFKKINSILGKVETAGSFVERNFLTSDNRFISIFGVLKEGLIFFKELKKTLKEEKEKDES